MHPFFAESVEERWLMRAKRSITKILEGRCRGAGVNYVGFIKANEAKSRGCSAEIYDPIAGRTVDVLSMGERWLFWTLRYDKHVVEIREQQMLHPAIVAQAAVRLGISVPTEILTTDFLVLYDDGRIVAYSIKCDRKSLNPDTRNGRKIIRRQTLEKQHWEILGVEFQIVFTNEVNRYRANNIQSVMTYYDPVWVQTPDQMYKFLIAHHVVELDMSRTIEFARIARENEDEIKKLFESEIKSRKEKQNV